MRTTVVPAQITSVEDKIAGNLTFTQLLLMIVPIFIGAALFVFLPPFTAFKIYKVAIVSIITITCLVLAMRIKGLLVMEWIAILTRYNSRPEVYAHGINSVYLRDTSVEEPAVKKRAKAKKNVVAKQFKQTRLPQLVRLEEALASPDADFHFVVNKKGGLNVRIKKTS